MSAQPYLSSGNPSSQSIYEVVTRPRHRIGTRGQLDGRVFYYTENTSASALEIGKLMVRPNIVANHQNLATGTTSLIVGDSKVTAVTLGATAAAADLYKDGFLNVIGGSGAGQMFQIRTHEAIASAGTGTFYIYGSVAVASDASTEVSLHANPYKSPQISVVDQLDIPVGVPTITIPVGSTTAQYGWLQTWGECAVLADEAIAALAQAVTIGTGTAGAVEEDDTATTVSQEFVVGWNMEVVTDAEYQAYYLTIRP